MTKFIISMAIDKLAEECRKLYKDIESLKLQLEQKEGWLRDNQEDLAKKVAEHIRRAKQK